MNRPHPERDRPPPRAIVPFPEDRLPPQNVEAEQGVLGAVLLDNDILHDIAPILRPDDLWRDEHRVIFGVILDLYAAGKPVDAIVLDEELRRRGESDRIKAPDVIADLLNRVPHAANAKYHAQIVRQKSIKREVIAAARELVDDGYDPDVSADGLLESAEKKIFAIADARSGSETVSLADTLPAAMDRIEARANGGVTGGMATGYTDLDDLLNGLQGGQLIILAARPSMGKSAFALNICDHVADRGEGVLFVSLEMGRGEIAERMLAARGRIDGDRLRKGNLGFEDMRKLGDAYDRLRTAPFHIDDSPGRTVLQVAASARRLKLRQGIGLVMIDYLQLLEGDADNPRESRQEQVAKASRRLKTLARELDVPVVALSQLNRNVESREDRRPRMADLRESGAIEQDADVVAMLHRPEYYDPNDQPGVAECLVLKNRNGATGVARLCWNGRWTRFDNLATANDPTAPGGF